MFDETPEDNSITCPDCESVIPAGMLEDLCPNCLLGGCLDTGSPSGLDRASSDTWAPGSDPHPAAEPQEAGTIIGRYRLLEQIGEGGFGVVYRAEQTEPVKRQLALKVIKAGMDSKEVIARFEAERQALALMDHPNIAHVHDAGTTEAGLPYFVMELVKGIPITTYCDQQRLGTRKRLELFIDVCSAVQHAHQKGIIHRDLKPSNILVAAQNSDPLVKVIDFGIAKAINMELTEKTVFTELGRMIGTPQYMSPEQAHRHALDVDTRSDIYSLGVTLYELLTGRPPLDLETLRSAGYAEMQRMIRDDLPTKPSASLAALGDTLADVARTRGTEPGKLQRALRGDLDWIVMRALEKDRNRRYQTTNALALDIRRFLGDEPVSASPPSTVYRCVQFSKRHRVGVTWTAAICVVILAATIGMTMLYFQARDQTVQAERQEELAQEQKKLAQEQTAIADRNAWESLMDQADKIRTPRDNPGRRWEALDLLRKCLVIPPDPANPDTVPQLGGTKDQRRLRDAIISCLAIVDMRVAEDYTGTWRSDPQHGGDQTIIAVNRSLTKFAHALPDGRIAIYPCPAPGQPPPIEPVLLGSAGAPVDWRLLKFSPDGTTLAAVSDAGDGRGPGLALWNLAGGNPESVDAGRCSGAAFDFFPEAVRCAVGRPGGGIDIVDCRSGKDLKHYPLPDGSDSIGVSRNGEHFAASFPGEDSVVVIQAESGEAVAKLASNHPRALAWSLADDSLAVCTDTCLKVWREREWASDSLGEPLELRGEGKEVAVVWSSDGRLLASQSDRDSRVRLWDPFRKDMELCSHTFKGTGSGLQFSKDRNQLELGLARSGDTLSLLVLEVATGDVRYTGRGHTGDRGIFDGAWNRTVNTKGYDLQVTSVSAPDDLVDTGNSLVIVASVGDDLHVRIFDAGGQMIVDKPESALASGDSLAKFKGYMIPFFAGSPLSPEDRQRIVGIATPLAILMGTLLATTGEDGVRFWNRDGRHLGHIGIPGGARGVVFSSDALFVASPGGVSRWAMEEERKAGQMVVRFREAEPVGDLHDCEQISLSPDERILAVASKSGLWLVDLKNGLKTISLPGSEGVTSCAISNDGQWLAAGPTNVDGEGVSIWAMPDAGTPVGQLELITEIPVNGPARVAFSPLLPPAEGERPEVTWLVTGDAKEYRFWKTGSWELHRDSPPIIPSDMNERRGKMTFSSRGTALAIAVDDEEMQVLDFYTGEELSSPDFDREIPLCFGPYGVLMVTARQSGGNGIFFWRLDVLRPYLEKDWGLDWGHLPEFPNLQFDLVDRVILP